MATTTVVADSMKRVAMGLETSTTYGTAVKPILLLEEYDNTLDFNQGVATQRVGAANIQRIHVARGFGAPEGSLPVLVTPDKFGPVIYALLGAVTKTGSAAPYSHAYVPSTDGSRPSFTLEHQLGNLFRVFSGMAIVSADFSANNGDFLRCNLQVSGKESKEYDATQCDAAVAWDAIKVLTAPMMTITRDSVEVADTYNPSWSIMNELVFASPQQAGVYTPRTGCGAGGVGATINFFVHQDAATPEGLLREFYGATGAAYPFGPASGDMPRMPIDFKFEANETIGTSGTAYSIEFNFPACYVAACNKASLDGMTGWNIQMVADRDASTGKLLEITVVNSVEDTTTAATDIS